MSEGAARDPEASSRPARRRLPRVLAGLAVIILAASVAFLATRPLGGATASPPSVAATGSPVPGSQVGRAAPDFVSSGDGGTPLLMDMDGNPIRLGDFAGRPLWIVFWATWCTPCQEEAGDIMAAYHAHRDAGLAVLAIDVQEPATAVRDFVAQHGVDYEIGLDASAQVRSLYGGSGLPVHFFLDRNGVIRDRSIGQLSRASMEEHLLAILDS